jgi:bacteriocin-like protein
MFVGLNEKEMSNINGGRSLLEDYLIGKAFQVAEIVVVALFNYAMMEPNNTPNPDINGFCVTNGDAITMKTSSSGRIHGGSVGKF